jgi:hypothetical protein
MATAAIAQHAPTMKREPDGRSSTVSSGRLAILVPPENSNRAMDDNRGYPIG